jgi:hypothetical protein
MTTGIRASKVERQLLEELRSGKGLAELVVVLLVISFGDRMRIRVAA